jgi:hypothetical protein
MDIACVVLVFNALMDYFGYAYTVGWFNSIIENQVAEKERRKQQHSFSKKLKRIKP